MCKFLMICISILSLFGLVAPNNDSVNNRNSLRANNGTYDQGYSDGYNAALTGSKIAPDNVNFVFTLPYEVSSQTIDTAYWPVNNSIVQNWFNNGSYDFEFSSFFNEWLEFYYDTQDNFLILNEVQTFTILLDLKNPVSIDDLYLEGYGFSAWEFAYAYSSTDNTQVPTSWNYSTGDTNSYYFETPNWRELNIEKKYFIKSIWLQFPMTLSTGTSSFPNTLVLNDLTSTTYELGYNKGQADGYTNGLNKGFEDGFDEGYTTGKEYAENTLNSEWTDKYNQLMDDYLALNNNYNNFLDEEYTLQKLFWSIGSTPFETFKTIWNVEFLGINLASFITRISLW